MMKTKRILCLLFFLLAAMSISAQKITTSIDTTRNKIGAQFNLTLKTTVDTTARVVFPTGKNFGQMEVIRSYNVDTVKKGSTFELIKKYGLTQFDSGRYAVPPLKVLVNDKPFFSDSLRVEVNNVKVDTLQQKMYDIKPIISAEKPLGNWWKYLVGILIIAGLGALAYFFIWKKKGGKKELVVYKSPIEKATSLLMMLEKKELWQHGEVKHYYSELTDIARTYIEEEIHIPAMESTTTEVIAGLQLASKRKNMKLSTETLQSLEKVLKQADLVKFAKSLPLDFEIQEDKKRIEKTIVQIHKAIPVVTVEDADDHALSELMRQKLLQKKKKQRIITGSLIAAGVIIVSLMLVVAIKGFDFVKDNIIGHPTKDLLEGEWVSSEYGAPPIFVETPKVLTRIDISKELSQADGAAMVKGMQNFSYGSFLDNFYVMVSTAQYKQETQIDLSKGLEAALKTIELKGGQDIISKQEDYDTKEGIAGRRSYGTFNVIDKMRNRTLKLYYDIVLFNQSGGVQQIFVVHEEGDKNGAAVAERILKSIELKPQQEQP